LEKTTSIINEDVQLKELLTEFVSRDGKNIEDILKRKPYTENNITYFKFKDFWSFILRGKTWPEKTYNKNKTIRLLENLFKAKSGRKNRDRKIYTNKN